ncbi:MAG: tetratricopeptide repeat protein, partial [Sedimentisphaerales bacterium]
LMSKPMLVTLPFVLLLVDYWPLNRFLNSKFSILNSIVEKVPFLFLAAVSSVITFFVQMRGSSLAPVNILPLKARIDNAFLSYARYIGKLFVPQNLAVFYPPDVRTIRSWQAVMSVLLLMVITILVIRFARNRRYLPVGWFWFVGTLVPVIGLVQVGRQAFADRYTYIPYIGLFIMLAWGLPELLSKLPQRKIVLALSMVIVLTPLGICTYQQVSYWYNSFTLFSHAIEVTKNNYIAYFSLGCAYGELGRGKDEIEAYKQTLKIEPDYADAHFNLGIAYANLGRYQDAIDSYKQAVKIKPDFVDAHYNLGFTCLAAGDKALALEEYKILKTLGDDKQADQLYNLIYK